MKIQKWFFLFGVLLCSVEAVIANERKVRLQYAIPYFEKMSSLSQTGMPVFLMGDFNSPSHLDWKEKKVPWPVTEKAAMMGLTDSFRQIHPDPSKTPGFTWPAARPFIKQAIDSFNPSPNTPQERVDFILSCGKSRVLNSHLIGERDVRPWPSDHRAVVSTFAIVPTNKPSHVATAHTSPWLIHKKGYPSVRVSPQTPTSGQPIKITWHDAPGNRDDYIMMTPVGTHQIGWGKTIRLYTHAAINGSIIYDQDNASGNRPEWHKMLKNPWPLKAGQYDIMLMLDDSYTVLAQTTVTVVEK